MVCLFSESSPLSLLKSSNMLKIYQKKASPSTYTESSTLSVLKTASPRTYCRAARPSTSAGNISTAQELDLQPLISTDAEMEDSEDTGEDSKCDIVYQLLCMACLGSGQTLHILRDEALKLYKLTVNDGRQLVHNVAPRVCWECEVLLKRVLQFRERVTECHHILYSARVTRSDVTRAPRLRVHRTAAVDIPPLTECDVSQVNPETETDVYIKREIEINVYTIPEIETDDIKREIQTDVYIERETETDVYIKLEDTEQSSLCPVCLCAGRRMISIRDKELHYYRDILTQNRVESGVSSPRLCWECCSVLLRATRFSEQAAESYRTLLPSLQHADVQDLEEFLQTSVRRPGRLNTRFAFSIDISPQDDDAQVMTVTKHDDDGEAASSSLETLSATRQESATTSDEETLKSFVDKNIVVSVREVASTLKNYQGHDINNEQSEETDAQTRTEVTNDIKTLNTLNSTHESTGDVNTAFVCDYCYKRFTSTAALERHIATYKIYPHNNKTVPSPCDDCAVVLCSDDQCSECPNKLYFLQHNNMQVRIAAKQYRSNLRIESFTAVEENFLRHKRTLTGEKPYQCKVCHKSFSGKSHLVSHIKTHTGEKPYQCEVCHKSFSFRSTLAQHIRTHTGEKPYQCNVCRKSFPLKNYLTIHLILHTGEKPYQCEVCHKLFSGKGHLVSHIRTHTGEKPYQCMVCHKSFSHKCSLVLHIRTHTGEKPYQCKVCHKSFSGKSHLVSHIKTHTGEKPYQCKVCHKSFSHKSSLVLHIRTHTGEKPYQCKVCHKSFSVRSTLAQHIRTHTGEKPYQCKVCHKSFPRKKSLAVHLLLHTGEKPYQCEVCLKSFPEKGQLVSHIRTHTVEKPYQCKVCHKSFLIKRSLVIHIRSHTGEKPYQCKVCHKSFSTQSNLAKHIRTHTGEKRYQCKVCHKSFSEKRDLVSHIRTHTGEKPFQCKVCHKSFSRKSSLVIHIRTHTGEKPYQCKVCHKSFSVRSTLVTHIKTHTGSTQLKS